MTPPYLKEGFMKTPCWSCSEPRDDADEFCQQCGAGPKPKTDFYKTAAIIDKALDEEETKPEIVETLAEPGEKPITDADRQKIIDSLMFE